MKYGNQAGNRYLAQYPQLQKWVNTCVCCGAVGYDAQMPEAICRKGVRTMGAENIRKFFDPLPVNESGICEHCQTILNKRG